MTTPLTSVTGKEVNSKSTSVPTKSTNQERSIKSLLQPSIYLFIRTQFWKFFPNNAKMKPCQAETYPSIPVKIHSRQGLNTHHIFICAYFFFILLLLSVTESRLSDPIPNCPALSTIANVDSYNGSFCFCNVRDSGHVDISCLYSSTTEQFKEALLAVTAAKKTVQQVGFFSLIRRDKQG